MSFVAPDYRAQLREFVHGYAGAHQGAILRAGDVFDFYARLMIDRRVSGEARTLIALVLAYFVLPDDVLPEGDLGPYGMLDDLYLAGHVFRVIRRELPAKLLREAWIEDEDLFEVMDVVYSESRAALGKLRKDVLAIVGLG